MVHAPRKVPVALHDRVKEDLQRMEHDGVIKKQEEPTDWLNSMIIVETPKKLRICIDPRDLNKAIKRARTFFHEDDRRSRTKHAWSKGVFRT